MRVVLDTNIIMSELEFEMKKNLERRANDRSLVQNYDLDEALIDSAFEQHGIFCCTFEQPSIMPAVPKGVANQVRETARIIGKNIEQRSDLYLQAALDGTRSPEQRLKNERVFKKLKEYEQLLDEKIVFSERHRVEVFDMSYVHLDSFIKEVREHFHINQRQRWDGSTDESLISHTLHSKLVAGRQTALITNDNHVALLLRTVQELFGLVRPLYAGNASYQALMEDFPECYHWRDHKALPQEHNQTALAKQKVLGEPPRNDHQRQQESYARNLDDRARMVPRRLKDLFEYLPRSAR